MDSEDDLHLMLDEIKQVIYTHVNDEKIEAIVKLLKDGKMLSISISGVSDMEIHFESYLEKQNN